MSRKELRQRTGNGELLLVRLNQEAQRKYYVAHLPWWRHPIVGYISCLPLTALVMIIPVVMRQFYSRDYFLEAPLFLVIVLVALVWGAGPAIFTIIIGSVALDYFFVPPYSILMKDWHEFIPLLPFLVAEFIIALITAQREAARRRAFIAEQDILLHAEELEQTNKRLEEANQLKSRFISMASHELKTPLTSIRGQAQIAMRKLKKQNALRSELEPIYTALEKIDIQTHRLHALVDDLLDLGALESGKMNLHLKRCDLSALCEEIVSDQRMLSGRDITLTLPEQPLILRADGDRVSQVIANLVTNAIKYSVPESPIEVTLEKQPAQALLKVHNSGEPIPQEQQMHLFELFYRASNAHSSSKEGWGLGLAISHDIVERHRGRIWVESSQDAGTSFFVELPLATSI